MGNEAATNQIFPILDNIFVPIPLKDREVIKVKIHSQNKFLNFTFSMENKSCILKLFLMISNLIMPLFSMVHNSESEAFT